MTRARRLLARLADDTLVVGLVILAVAAVVMAISYRAQNGLPWQRSYEVQVEVPDAGKLTKNAEVRIGGARVGQVLRIEAMPPRGEKPPYALLDVQLRETEALPADTKAEVRIQSVLGGRFLSLIPGKERRTIPEDGRLPLRNASVTVDLDQAFRIFDPPGREAVRTVVRELGDALAGRGGDLNETFANSASLLPPLRRVLARLDATDTDLPGFLRGAAAAAGALETVSGGLDPLLADASATFGGLDRAGDALGAGVAELPRAEAAADAALGDLRPVLDDAAAIADDLRPAAARLPRTAGRISSVMRTATRVDPQAATLARPLSGVLAAVRRFSANPASSSTLRLLGSTDLATFGASAFVGLGAILQTTWEAEEHCRVTSNWAERLADVTSDGDAGGNWLRMIPFFKENELLPTAEPAEDLRANPYPIQNAQECEAGNEPVLPGRRIGNPPGVQGASR